MRAVYISVTILFLCLKGLGQVVEFSGQVLDDQHRPIAYASVWIAGIHTGAITNQDGIFSLKLQPATYSIAFRAPGYRALFQTVQVSKKESGYRVRLSITTNLSANAADADSIMRRVIAGRKAWLYQITYLAGSVYAKAIQRLDKYPHFRKDIAHVLHINPDRRGIINFSEYNASVHLGPDDYLKEDVTSARVTDNSRDLFDFNRSPELKVNFYENTLRFNGFNEHAFLSPIADDALKFYRYLLVGQFNDMGRMIDVISVLPAHPQDEYLLSGQICVVDGEWDLYSVNLLASRKARMDFIDSIRIKQQFVPVGTRWVAQSVDFNFYGKFLGFKYSGLFLRGYEDLHPDAAFQTPFRDRVFYSNKEDYKKDDQYRDQNRPLPLTPEEEKFYRLAELSEKQKKEKELDDSLKNKNNRLRLLPFLLRGYTLHDYSNNSSWFIPSPYSMGFYNTVEGWGVDLRVQYTKVFDTLHTLTLVPDFRYGFSDKVPNANVFASYTYNPFKRATVYAHVGSDFLDLNNSGTITPFLNTLNSLLLGNNYLKLYQSRFIMAGTAREVANGVLLSGQFEYANRRSLFNTTLHTFNKDSVYLTSNNPLDPNGNTPLFPEYRAFVISASATFTFDQQYRITPAGKFIVPSPYPRVRVNYRTGIPVLGSDVNYNFVSVDVFQDRLNMGIYGYTSYFVSAGKFLDARSLYYPDYKQFNGGESFFFNAVQGSFHFLNYYTYSTDKQYLEIHAEHNFCGLFLSHVPLLDGLNLQEIIGGSYLTQGTLPNYEEVYIGLKRSVVRVDYGLAFGRFTPMQQGFRLCYFF